MPEFLNLIPPEQALSRLLGNLSVELKTERIRLEHALGRITAEPVVSASALPPFPRSTVDGYAVLAADTYGTSESLPSYLCLAGEVPMGALALQTLNPGSAILIHTGGMLPEHADAVVMLEYTQQASGMVEVFRPVAEAKAVMISPPISKNGNSGNGTKPSTLPIARLGYFNLHGLADAAEWYGQRDPLGASDGPDYPVALRPADVRSLADKNPLVVFSEACYGAHILSKTVEQALALQFLKAGTQVVAGSTTMSYGAINTPLIGADLLGNKFWKALLEGLTAGEALQRAKIEMASEMHRRQGYLDGEDQKTLISFILLGDPLMRLTEEVRNSKHRKMGFRRLADRPLQVKTVCDRALEADKGEPIPPEVITSVKQVVANYLPGMSDAHTTYTAERAVCVAHGHTCPTGQLNNGKSCKSSSDHAPHHHMVVLSKTLENAGHTHPQFARLTLDNQGKLVKIVVSR